MILTLDTCPDRFVDVKSPGTPVPGQTGWEEQMQDGRTWRLMTGILPAVLTIAAGDRAMAQFVEPDVSVLYTLHSEQPGDGFGWAAEAIGDLNGAGASVIIVSALRNSEGGPRAGKVYVFSGRDGTLLHTIVGAPFNRLGHSVAGVGDVNGDGVPDYAV